MKARAKKLLPRRSGPRELATLAEIARSHDIEAWLVGGAVRDRLLGRPLPDLDVAVAGSAETLAREMEARGLGRAVFLSRGRPGPRVYRVAGERAIDLAELEGASLEEDLARRDFTVNAMAVDLRTGELADPHGGAGDLARRRLRLVAARNLQADPLRVLRAARFLATHGLRPDRETRAACRRAAPLLARVAPERVATELAKMLEAPAPGPALRWAAAAGILAPALRLAPGGARWRALARRARAFDAAGLGRLPAARRRRLRLALLARDLAFTPAEARRFLERRRFPGDDARAVGRLLELVREASRIEDERSEWRWIRDAGPLAEDALRLVPLACPKARGEARRLAAGLRRRAAPLAVGGGDVLRWLGVAPGPHVGRLLRELEIEVLSGRVKGRPEARRWLRTAWRALLAQGAAPGSEREGGL